MLMFLLSVIASLEPSTDVDVRMSLCEVISHPLSDRCLPDVGPEPTEHDVVKDDIRCLDCLFDGDVWLSRLDADIRCLCCVHIDDVCCVTDGFEELFCDDAEVDKDVCITDGDVELGCLDVLVGCLGCIHVADVACITDGVVALRCLDVLIGCLLCVVVGDGGCVTDGLVGL